MEMVFLHAASPGSSGMGSGKAGETNTLVKLSSSSSDNKRPQMDGVWAPQGVAKWYRNKVTRFMRFIILKKSFKRYRRQKYSSY